MKEINNYGRLAFDMVNDVKKQLINEQLKENFKIKELFFKGRFNNLSWQVDFKGLEGTVAKFNFVINQSNTNLVFNLNGINVFNSTTNEVNFNLPILKANTLKISCSELIEQPFTLLILGNVVDDKIKNKLFLYEKDDSIDAFYYDEGYKYAVLSCPQDLFGEDLQAMPLTGQFFNACHKLASAIIAHDDVCILSKVDGYLTITRKSSQFGTAQIVGGYNITDKACLVPISHSRLSYHIVYIKNNTITSLLLASNYTITRTIVHSITLTYPIVDMGGCVYAAGSSYLFNGFWFVDSNNDAYLVATKNYTRSTTTFSYHNNAFKLGKAETLRLYVDGFNITCYLIYQNKVTILAFYVNINNTLNFLQLISKEQYSCVDDGMLFRGEHLLKYRELFTSKPLL